MSASIRLASALLLLGSALAATTSVAAQPATQWTVHGVIVGKHGKASKDISGIACATATGFPRRCLVIDDNLQAAQQVTLREGGLDAGDAVPLIEDAWDGKALELDGEGVAYVDGVFYVIGSHGHPRDAAHKLDPVADRDLIRARIVAASQIVPLRVDANGTMTRLPVLTLSGLIAAEPDLKPAAGRRLEANGLTIEGIAMKGDRLLAGFRGPSLPGGRAAVLQVSLAGLRDGSGPAPRLFKLPLGEGQGVRDITPFRDGFMVLAGPTADGNGRYALFAWDGTSDDGVRSLGDITQISAASQTRKPEAILPLDGDAKATRVLVLFDGAKEGDPTVLTLPSP